MKPIVRATQVEAFRRWFFGNASFITEQSVIDSITHEFTGNNLTRIGTAFHRICQFGNSVPTESVDAGTRKFTYYNKPQTEPVPNGLKLEVDGHSIVFDDKQVSQAVSYHDSMPLAFHEIREYKEFGKLTVTGCADVIDGNIIRDIKTKYSLSYCDTDYTDSEQWRLYLSLFEADTFIYDIFVFDGYSDTKHIEDVRGLELKRITPPITCRRYACMEDDILNVLREMYAWLQYRDLLRYLNKSEL